MKKIQLVPHIKLDFHQTEIHPLDGFLRVARSQVTFNYPNGEQTPSPFPVDKIIRQSEDAVVIVAYYKSNNSYKIYLRSAIRPALAFRDYSNSHILEEKEVGNLWELPAGLAEPEETGYGGLWNAAVRETREELGFEIKSHHLMALGHRSFSSVGLSAERLFYFAVKVNPKKRLEPTLDGGPFEKYGEIITIDIKDALTAINDGTLMDAKTEIGIRRFAETINKEK